MNDSLNIGNILALIGLLAVNAFFVAAEYAIVRVRRTRLEELIQQGAAGARQAQRVVDKLDRYIATTQLGITMAGIGLGWVGEPVLTALFTQLLDWPLQALDVTVRRTLSAVVSFLMVTFVSVVVAELVPKTLTIQYPERVALAVSQVLLLIGAVARPFIWALNASADLILRLLGVREDQGAAGAYSVQELKLLVEASEESGVIEDTERDMLHAVFDFGDLTARELMVPRTEMLAVDADAPLDELIHLAIRNPRSKFPVYEGDLDHVIGVAHVKDLVRVQHDERRAVTIRGLIREALFVPDTLRLDKLLAQFRVTKQHLAIVLDEYGGTAGLVTLDDLMEQIVGEVQDPFDRSAPEVQRLPDGSALVDGLTLIETVNEQLGLNLKDEYYDTIAGYILGRLGRMAKVGDGVDQDGRRLKVEALDGLRIARVLIGPRKAEAGDGSAAPDPAA
ncbi:MAG: HlyC/CorC family transporter [Anaerolineales bacterium]|nr:HlyC/CorC family transporter [Anaerolineales bacterium]